MFQIDNSTAAPVLPAPDAAGTPGYFTGGNPGAGSPPTTLPADFMNMIMLELINVVDAAGIIPSKTTYTQVRDAVTLLALAAIRNGAYAIDTGAVNAIVATPAIPPVALVAGLSASVRLAYTNTGAVTLNWAGLGAKPVTSNGSALGAGAIAADAIHVFEYDAISEEWELVSPLVSGSIPTATTTAAGIVALALDSELTAGTDTSKAVTPAAAANAVQTGEWLYGVDTGAANALIVNLTPAPAALVPGMMVVVKNNHVNTGPATLNVNGFGNKPIRYAGNPLQAGALLIGQLYVMTYDGANWQVAAPSTGIVASQLGINGQRIWADGLIEQWGKIDFTLVSAVSHVCNFWTPFPTNAWFVLPQIRIPTAFAGNNMMLEVIDGSLDVNGFRIQLQTPSSGGANASGVYYEAKGN